jgi:hypothetical protein
MRVTDRYHVRKTGRFLFPYIVYRGGNWPGCVVVTVCMTEAGAKRAVERDKVKQARPLPPPPPLVWQEGR